MLLEERYIDFICENKLTQGQFLILYLVFKERKDLIVKYKQHFPSEDGSMIGKYWIEDLVTRKWLERTNKGFVITTAFREAFCNIFDATEELMRKYPSTMEIDGKILPLTAIDVIELSKLYNDAILGSQKEHEEVLKDLQYGIENRLINIGIKKFVQSKYWKGIRDKRAITSTDGDTLTQHQSFG